jgi:hypothetical protein
MVGRTGFEKSPIEIIGFIMTLADSIRDIGVSISMRVRDVG